MSASGTGAQETQVQYAREVKLEKILLKEEAFASKQGVSLQSEYAKLAYELVELYKWRVFFYNKNNVPQYALEYINKTLHLLKKIPENCRDKVKHDLATAYMALKKNSPLAEHTIFHSVEQESKADIKKDEQADKKTDNSSDKRSSYRCPGCTIL